MVTETRMITIAELVLMKERRTALIEALKDCLEAFHSLNAGGYSRQARCFNPGLYDDCLCSACKARAALDAAGKGPYGSPSL